MPTLAKFDGPYDKTIRQPCLKCGGVPPMVSRCLREAFKHDLAAKGELTKMGIHCDLDIDTFMLMDSAQRDELFRSSGVTNVMRVSIVHMLKKLEVGLVLISIQKSMLMSCKFPGQKSCQS